MAQYESEPTICNLEEEYLPDSIEEMLSWNMYSARSLDNKPWMCAKSLVGFIVENYGYDKFIELCKKETVDSEVKDIYEHWVFKVKSEIPV